MSKAEELIVQLAHDVHDDISGSLTVMRFQISALEQILTVEPLDRGAVAGALGELRSTVAHAHSISRTIEQRLYPEVLQVLGLVAGLEELATEHERLGHPVRLVVDDEMSRPQLSRASELQVYRFVQECLNNAAKHAPGPAMVTIGADRAALVVTVEDAGPGLPPEAVSGAVTGMGLRGLAWRAHQLGADLAMTARGEILGGALIALTVPHAF